MRRLAGIDALAFFRFVFERQHPYGGFGFFLDLHFGFGGAVPVSQEELALFYLHLEVFPAVHLHGVVQAVLEGAVKQSKPRLYPF